MREKTLNKPVGLQGQRAFPLPPTTEKRSGRSISHALRDILVGILLSLGLIALAVAVAYSGI